MIFKINCNFLNHKLNRKSNSTLRLIFFCFNIFFASYTYIAYVEYAYALDSTNSTNSTNFINLQQPSQNQSQNQTQTQGIKKNIFAEIEQSIYIKDDNNNINNINDPQNKKYETQLAAATAAQKKLDEKFKNEKQVCFKKFWVERCINKLSEDYYQVYDLINQKIYQYNYEKRVAEFNEKQKILALKVEEEKKQSQSEIQQAQQNQSQHQVKLQFLNPASLLASSPRDFNTLATADMALDMDKAAQISKNIRAQITNAPIVKTAPIVNVPPIAQNVEKFQQKQQKVVKKQNDLNSRIKTLDEFVKKYQTP